MVLVAAPRRLVVLPMGARLLGIKRGKAWRRHGNEKKGTSTLGAGKGYRPVVRSSILGGNLMVIREAEPTAPPKLRKLKFAYLHSAKSLKYSSRDIPAVRMLALMISGEIWL